MKNTSIAELIVMGIAGAMIGSGVVGIFYETKIIPDLQTRIENLNHHNDTLREAIIQNANDILEMVKEEFKFYEKE